MVDVSWISALPAVTTVGVAVIAGASGIFAYSWQKKLERRAEIARKRQEVYSEVLRTMMLLTKDDPQANEKYRQARADVMLYASDNVVRALGSFSRVVDVGDRSEIATRGAEFRGKALEAYGNLVASMRIDVIAGAQLTPNELAGLAPFK
jgi:hypothetical protein